MKFIIDKKLLLIFSFSFVLFTIIGTISHEYGHIVVAKSLGYKTTLHFASMEWDRSGDIRAITKLIDENNNPIKNKKELENNKQYYKIVQKYKYNSLLIFIGGPIQTSITGLAGLLILYYRRKKRAEIGFKFIDWLAVFLALFWLRPVFNLVMSVTSGMFSPKGYYFGGDELYFIAFIKDLAWYYLYFIWGNRINSILICDF